MMIAGLSLLYSLNLASFRLHLAMLSTLIPVRRELRTEDPTQKRGTLKKNDTYGSPLFY